MCGIIGYLGSEIFVPYILDGLRLLLNRGYDSVGISTILGDVLKTIKHASTNDFNSLEIVEKEVLNENFNSSIGIGHTRWATHGAKTSTNAHPHGDTKDRISIVHNGIIENYHELKNYLIELGYTFKSKTDTEVISVFIGKYLDDGQTIIEAISTTIQQLQGTWALVIIHKDFPNKMWITRNGSPLLLGMEDEYIMVASEQIAFGNYIEKYIVLENHDIIEISKEGRTIQYSENIHSYSLKQNTHVEIEKIQNKYKHWMLKEIMEQSDAVNRAMNNGGRISDNRIKFGGLDCHKAELLKINHLILLGCGTSYHSGLWALTIFKKLEIFDTVSVYDGAEFSAKDIPNSGVSGFVFLSQSGETKDLHRCIHIANDRGIIKIGIVNVVDSMIARETDCGVYLNAGREVAVASTKSFTNQCVVLAMMAIWFSQWKGTMAENRYEMIRDLRNLSFHINNILKHINDVNPILEEWLSHESHTNTMFILGKGPYEAIAKEGALKIKEVSYIHAEGYSSSALKHGSFALIVENTPIIVLNLGDEYKEKNNNVCQEIQARGANVLLIEEYDELKPCSHNVFTINNNKTFLGILANIYLQIISYNIAIRRENNPDYPRNLAKVVTVE